MQEAVILTILIVIGLIFLVIEYHYNARKKLRYMKANQLTKQALRDKIEIYED
ncbi:hypothetical protein [Listeria floridensis]|uniref:hypothetical protein n=1 Tax=Listeria floridensis TaxID=1494962 RepID=UPI0004B91B6D|nr:hypothetical protein [Listeria floridensis]